jgi:hypothetical protein
MRECPKCSSTYGDDAKICRTCGAILETIEELSPHLAVSGATMHRDNERRPATAKRRGSWTCSHCGRPMPADFEVCQNCGTNENGVPDPEFSKERSSNDDRRPSSDDDRARDAAKLAVFSHRTHRQCSKCGSVKVIPDARIRDQGEYSNGKLQVMVDGQPDAAVFKDSVYGGVLAEICGDCGYIEVKVENPSELYGHYVRSRSTPADR